MWIDTVMLCVCGNASVSVRESMLIPDPEVRAVVRELTLVRGTWDIMIKEPPWEQRLGKLDMSTKLVSRGGGLPWDKRNESSIPGEL